MVASNPTQSVLSAPATERVELLVVCGVVGLVGAILPNIINVIASTIAEHDFIADTISDLGRGPHKWIMDLGFYVNAAGLTCLAVGAAHAHLGGARWSAGIFALLATAMVTVMLGLWDKFGTGQDLSVHTKLTFALGPLYAAGPLLMRAGVAKVDARLSVLFIASAALWLGFATAFKLAPTSYDGILEKVAVLTTLLWTVPLSLLLLRRARALTDANRRTLE
ncbi:DUF998 domain-containing protein [Thalassococcus sp. S3]|uniref:DUF998 domain-containing protein n=1 Tax=Thalassococcus sp. S3 TaxID=2017482 RepID=UPI0013EE6DCD|nr:DUF998 domain-containing protein [Thalassococcus sp. S3]